MKRLLIILSAILAMLPAVATGKTMIALGDSYVRNHRRPYAEAWHARVAHELGLNYINCGRNGAAVGWDRTKEGFGPTLTERAAYLPDADIILIIAGHNDAGFVAATNDAARFESALNTLLDTLAKRYPDATIGYVTPWDVDRPGFKDVHSIINKVCASRGIPVLDATRCGIDVNNPDFRQRYFQGPNDTAHLNAEGHELMLAPGREFVKHLMSESK